MAEFAEKNRQVFEYVHLSVLHWIEANSDCSKKAASYMNDFSGVIQSICNQVENRRLWISDKWTDTHAGKGQEFRLLEYACGPGAISVVSIGNVLPRHKNEWLTCIDTGSICDKGPWIRCLR